VSAAVVELTCQHCGKAFAARKGAKCCSNACRQAFYRGRKRKGRKRSQYMRDHAALCPNRGPWPGETRGAEYWGLPMNSKEALAECPCRKRWVKRPPRFVRIHKSSCTWQYGQYGNRWGKYSDPAYDLEELVGRCPGCETGRKIPFFVFKQYATPESGRRNPGPWGRSRRVQRGRKKAGRVRRGP
jgi:predicted nucleic acid-binding Zn ribbon protein